jgi:hypothetical protein
VSYAFNDSSFISKRMIDQFFTDEEGPDRDWQLEEQDMFENYERERLQIEN